MAALLRLVAVLFIYTVSVRGEGVMQKGFNSIHQMMTGQHFHSETFDRLAFCMRAFDPTLLSAHENAWQQLLNFWRRHSNRWGKAKSHFRVEQNATVAPDLENMEIQEPCNAASRLPSYLELMKPCRRQISGPAFNMPEAFIQAFVRSITFNGFGCVVPHTTKSLVGNQVVKISNVFPYLVNSVIIEAIGAKSPILVNLKKTVNNEENLDAVSVIEDLSNMLALNSLLDYAERIKSNKILTFDRYCLAVAASISTILFPQDPFSVFNSIHSYYGTFLDAKEADKNFLIEKYIPAMQEAMSAYSLSNEEIEQIKNSWYPLATKFAYSLVWFNAAKMESIFGPFDDSYRFSDETITAKLETLDIPFAKQVGEDARLHGFYRGIEGPGTVENFPGESWCSELYPHNHWHQVSQRCYVDAMYAADQLFGILKSS